MLVTECLLEKRFSNRILRAGIGTALKQLMDNLDNAGDEVHMQRGFGKQIPAQSFMSGGPGDRKKRTTTPLQNKIGQRGGESALSPILSFVSFLSFKHGRSFSYNLGRSTVHVLLKNAACMRGYFIFCERIGEVYSTCATRTALFESASQ